MSPFSSSKETSGKPARRRVAVIGCTGSVGSSVMDVCRSYPERFEVTVLAANTGRDVLPRLCGEFRPRSVVLSRPRSDLPDGISVLTGESALTGIADRDDVDHIVFASSGVAAVAALDRALASGKEISLANKESALILGELLAPFVRSGQVRPLDSEHNAIWQCMAGERYDDVQRLYLTASGGPFLRTPLDQLEHVTPSEAVAHPVWAMGSKISVDSATMINKGIELIEAHCLFGIPFERIKPLIHPGSKVHGLVSFIDGTTKLLMSCPDMRLASLTALSAPERLAARMDVGALDLDMMDLHFERPEAARFPGLSVAQECGRMGGVYPVILIAADAAAVELFLAGQIAFTDIVRVISLTLERYGGNAVSGLAERTALYDRAYSFARSGARTKGWA